MNHEVTLVLPALSRYVATARVTTASLAAEMDFPVDHIDDLRVGVNELVSCLIEWAEDNGGTEMQLTFRPSPDSIEVDGKVLDGDDARTGGTVDELDSLTSRLLGGVTDEHSIEGRAGRIVKRRGTA